MIGGGERIGNTTPPSITLPAFAAAQATVVGLARLAIGGFAPAGHPALTAVAVLARGILVTISSGHPGAKGTSTARPAWQPHASG
jgi:hypothetical protein